MLKVIIADDEERVCRLVRMLVDWDELGMEVIGTAANGFEALDLVNELSPDILITDIRMPGCDGIELIGKAKAILPHLQIALISGYAQFEYAQTAMDYDVGGYILKPIKKEIITATLEKLGNACRERAEMESASERFAYDSGKSSELLRSRLLEDLLSKRLLEPSLQMLESEYGFKAADGLFQAFIVKMDCSFDYVRDPSFLVIKKKTAEVFESAVAPSCVASVFQVNLSAGYGILNYQAHLQPQVRRALREFLNQLQAHRFSGVEISMGIGRAADCAGGLPDSMRDARVSIAERLVEGTGRLLEVSLPDASPGIKKFTEKYVRAVERAADMMSEEEAERVAGELSDEIVDSGLHGYAMLEAILSIGKMFTLRLRADEDANILREFEERCELCGSVGKLLDCLKRFITGQLREVRGKLENEAIKPIRVAKNYILQHYSEPITLEDVCSAAGFSVSYFSKLFKQETGEGFSRYLSRVRIDKAKELLRDTDLPVAAVCESVGYSDLKHFSGTFKKMTSLSPGQYRKLYG